MFNFTGYRGFIGIMSRLLPMQKALKSLKFHPKMFNFSTQKKHLPKKMLCAQDETRTHTVLRPLPPQSSVYTNFTTCARVIFFVPRTGLEPAHLAACAPETHASTNSAIWAKKKSGKRDSNSRPRPWQGRALPTELFPQFFSL